MKVDNTFGKRMNGCGVVEDFVGVLVRFMTRKMIFIRLELIGQSD